MAIPGNGKPNGEGSGDEYEEQLWEALEESAVPQTIRVLADTAHRGDLQALVSALDNHTGSIDDPVEDGDTVLHLSCLYGHLPCVQMLVERGANLESRDEEQGTPLHDACAGGYMDIAQYLLNYVQTDAERVTRMLNSVDSEGDTPLHHAARGEHLDVVKLLLEVGADAEKRNVYGQTPADMADAGTEVHTLLVGAPARAAAPAAGAGSGDKVE